MKKFRQNRTIKRNVLIVDDELINREILGNILSQEYTVSYADNAKDALEKLAEKDSSYSLVLLDLLMPVMDGFRRRLYQEALRHARGGACPLRTHYRAVRRPEPHQADRKGLRHGALYQRIFLRVYPAD